MFNNINVLSLTYYSIIGIGYSGNIFSENLLVPHKKTHMTSNRCSYINTVADPGISKLGCAVPAG